MKKILPFTLLGLMLLTIALPLLTPETAYAAPTTVESPELICLSFPGTLDVGGCIALTGYYLLYVPTSWILFASATVFDTAMAFTLSTEPLNQPFVVDTWETIRDIANLFFVFILLYIAIGTILQIGGVQLKKALTTVIIVALVINFSLFFTRVIVDASNIFAIEFYNAIGTPSNTPHLESGMGVPERSVAAAFIGGFDPQKMISADMYTAWKADKGLSKSALFIVFLFGAVVNVAAAYVLFLASFLMIGRVVAFLFLAITSPIAFMSYAIPKGSGFASKWWGQLTGQALLAPVFLFFLYVIAKMVEPPSAGSPGFIDKLFSSGTGFSDLMMGIILNFTVILTALFMALKVARKLSGEVGAMTSKVLGSAAALTGVGLAGKLAMRHTVGRGASRLAESEKVRSIGRRMPGVGMAIDTTLNKMGSGAFNKYTKDQEKRKVSYGAKVTEESRTNKFQRVGYETDLAKKHEKGEMSDTELADSLAYLKMEKEGQEKANREQHATSLEHPTKVGKIIQRITGGEIADREAAIKVREGDKGKGTKLEQIEKLIAEEAKEQSKKTTTSSETRENA